MSAPTVAVIHSSAAIDSVDIRHVAHLDQVEMTMWSRGRLVQTLALSTEDAVTTARQILLAARTQED
jgi:hypothetical protein